jgi:hypothetical protein
VKIKGKTGHNANRSVTQILRTNVDDSATNLLGSLQQQAVVLQDLERVVLWGRWSCERIWLDGRQQIALNAQEGVSLAGHNEKSPCEYSVASLEVNWAFAKRKGKGRSKVMSQ